jgi:hydroxyquinol 1,2-dioxygenase
MIIANERDVTAVVLAEAARTPDARTREILQAGITHLHAFVRDARLTENEFRHLVMAIARLGQMTDASHNGSWSRPARSACRRWCAC